MSLDITVGQYHANKGEVATNDGDDQGAPQSGKLGLAVGDVTAEARQQLQLPESIRGGAVVEQVRPDSPASDAGLRPGDVILEVDRHATGSADQFVSAVHGTTGGKDLLLLVWSKGNASYRTVHPDDNKQNG